MSIDRDLWLQWQNKFVDALRQDALKHGWSFDILEKRLSKEFPRATQHYFVGMKRSGNHAIVNWAIKNCFESQIFFNNINSPVADLVNIFNAEHIAPSFIDRVICTFEQLPMTCFKGNKKPWYVIRDPYNWLASWVAHMHFDETSIENDVAVYIQNAKTSQRKILYNEWVQSEEYRINLAVQLGFVNKDMAMDEVPNYGSGSSFDRKRYNGKGRQMKVLDRWKSGMCNSIYLDLVRKNYEEFENIAKSVFDMDCPFQYSKRLFAT